MASIATKLTFEAHVEFNGDARSAFEFYKDVFGGELALATYGDSPMAERFPGRENQILHARLRMGDAAIMGCDVPAGYEKPRGYHIAIQLADRAEAERIFEALSHGGEIEMPMQETFWSLGFGMVTDRYGIAWMVNVPLEG